MPIIDTPSQKRIGRRRRWFQFSLSTLLLFTTAVSVLMSWFAVKRREVAREKLAAEQLQKEAHATVLREFRDGLRELGWLDHLLGRDLPPVIDITLFEAMDANPKRNWGLLGDLPYLEECSVFYGNGDNDDFNAVLERRMGACTFRPGPHGAPRPPRLRFKSAFTPSKCAAVERMTELRQLSISFIRIDDATFLRGLHKLEKLDLGATGVGDDVLDAIRDCPQLSELSLAYDDITDAGLPKLRSLPNLSSLRLQYTYLTDAGLKTLQELKNLKYLEVEGTAVSKQAVDEIRRVLPKLEIFSNFDWPFAPTPNNGTNTRGMGGGGGMGMGGTF